ncbi:MAG: DedA family protein [Bacteroidia bacterium]|nr:DedA family protein [Bacteroidia bacterium]
MPSEVVYYINQYGYLAIFILIFLQDVGFPNPIPNELVLLFSGYLIFSGIFKFYIVIFVALLADFIGTSILYFVFKKFGIQFLKHKPRWIPVSQSRIESFSRSLSEGGLLGMFICRLTPYIRGYTTVIAGLLQVKIAYFLPIALLSASVWAGAYILTGWLLGPWWKQIESNPHFLRNVMLSILIFVLFLFIIKFFLNRLRIRWKSN